MIPVVLREEMERLKAELKGVIAVSQVFDGTTEVAEIFAMTLTFVSKGKRCQRCIGLRLYNKSFDGPELARAIMKELVSFFAMEALPTVVRYSTRDGASVNGAATEIIRNFIPRLVDLICMSHTANVAGQVLSRSCPSAKKVMELWSRMVKKSQMVRRLFFEYNTDVAEDEERSALRNSYVRWFASFEVVRQMFRKWSIIKAICANVNIGLEETRASLSREIELHETVILRELAVTVDVGSYLVKLCYNLEGDGFISELAYDLWQNTVEKLTNVRDGEDNTTRLGCRV